jgi:hypothetical protein
LKGGRDKGRIILPEAPFKLFIPSDIFSRNRIIPFYIASSVKTKTNMKEE